MDHGDSARTGQRAPGSALGGTGGPPFPVIGLGASAGGLEALHTFFAHLPPDTGMAFVVILHLSPTHESQAAALLQRQTSMPVQQVTEVVPLVPNHVYVIPPSQHLELVDGHIRLAQPQTEQDRHAPIDHFFRTLADTHTRHAVAIILSGSGSDGTIGIMRIKEWGGAIFVQDPEEAAFTSMPRSAIATGLVDDVLPVARMPERLTSYWRQDPVLVTGGDGSAAEVDGALLQEILAVLRVHTTHDFSQYKRPTMLRRIGRRMQVVGVIDLPAYLAVLRQHPEEVPALLQDLLISVTNFFRDPPVWTAVQAIIPQLFAGKGPGDQVRVWVPACATGEEAYTVAMLLLDHALTLDHPPAIQVFATDIDEPSIAQARRATYRETIAGNVDPERLRRFFVLEQGHYRVSQEVRELVMFATHNVLRDPPFTKLDLITCRNLLIYLTQAAQAQVIQTFQFSLRPGGYLLLGTAESLDGTDEHFVAVAKTQHLYRRSTQLSPPPVLTIGGGRSVPLGLRDRGPAPPALPSTAGDLHQRLLLAHMPASALITADYEIVHLTRGAHRFLHLEGEPSTNLLRLVHPDLRLDLHTLLFQAGQGQQRVERRGIRLTGDATVQLVDLVVEPVADGAVPDGALLVLFADGGAADGTSPGTAEGNGVVRDLATDLARTKEQLQITIEQYATSSEEYQAANEELQAINEELRAASEELETSKEELQAVNEELSTVNQQLKHTVAELTATNNDLQNLIAATEIATLFLDRALCITRYTPSAEQIFHLIPTDRGRPLAHVTHTLQEAHLADDAAQVLRTLIPIEQELVSADGHGYLVQIRPYRTTDDRIAGVVITCVDITARTQAEAVLAERARLLDLSNDAIIVRDVDERVIYWNDGATEIYGWTRDEALGQPLHTLLRTEFEAPLEHLLVTLQQQDRMEGEVVQVTRDGRRRTLACRWALDRDAAGQPGAILTTYNDITARKLADAQLRASEERFRAMFEQANVGIVQVTMAGQIVLPNPGFCHLIGYSHADACRLTLRDITHPDDYAREVALTRQLLAGDIPGFAIEKRYLHHDGRIVWGQMTATLMRDEMDEHVSTLAIVEDISERKQAEAAVRESEARFRAVANLVPDLLWSTDPSGQPTWYNQRWYDYTGQPRTDIQGFSWLDLIHPDDREPSRRTFQHAMETGAPLRLEHRMRGADGSYRWFLVRAHPLHDDAGRIVRWYGAATDMHEERLALEEAEAALQTRDHFLSIASHELRTPLTSLMGYVQLLRKRAAQGTAGTERTTEIILGQAQRLNMLIEQLLDVSRLQQGQFVIEPQPTDLAALVAQVVDDVRATQPSDTQHTIVVQRPDTPVMITGDPHRLEQVLQNLLSNAVKYSPQGGRVQVRVGQTATDTVVEVSDQGIGIPAEDHARLFEPFYRASNGATHAKGFGLGLHIVREIVERHGGRIAVESTQGQGSTFRVTLPQPASHQA